MSIQKAYNSWANIYDSNHNKTRDLDKVVTIKTLSNYQFDNVLELGCGTGKNTEWLVEHAKQIIGLDFSDEMLKKAKEKIRSNKVKFQKADLTKGWNVPNYFADLVTSSLTLEHIENLDFIFQQAHLKLKTKGKFFISELHPFKQYLGTKAKYDTDQGEEELEVYIHHVSEFLKNAKKMGFILIHFQEWFDNDNKEIPRLISFVFEKND
ncbi:MAG: class I SAM-dependent methyltransferase [Bacteroidota bacterium]